ncbi:hypothetical protein FSP39_010089 [Pinctada imbricata]|uniref:C2H2-type domain-containing protein n=1 Tax=Pinctada imbricata TaxID=66713 RepID=A0AA89BZC1_PINIB|nr:hypothetical protein FSP39_010089 [Pinctada imbricata]
MLVEDSGRLSAFIKDLGANILMETPMTGITSGRPRPGIWNPEEAFKFGMRELAPGSSVYVYEDEYICALSKIKLSEKTNRKDGTPAARYLLSVFYTSSELVNATIRNDGDDPTKPQGPYVPLNKTIIYAIEGESMQGHIEKVHRLGKVCEICGKLFRSMGGYNMHKKMYHGNAEEFPKCRVCSKIFPSYSRLKIHEHSHSQEKAFKCNDCQHLFKYKQNLKSHKCKIKIWKKRT